MAILLEYSFFFNCLVILLLQMLHFLNPIMPSDS